MSTGRAELEGFEAWLRERGIADDELPAYVDGAARVLAASGAAEVTRELVASVVAEARASGAAPRAVSMLGRAGDALVRFRTSARAAPGPAGASSQEALAESSPMAAPDEARAWLGRLAPVAAVALGGLAVIANLVAIVASHLAHHAFVEPGTRRAVSLLAGALLWGGALVLWRRAHDTGRSGDGDAFQDFLSRAVTRHGLVIGLAGLSSFVSLLIPGSSARDAARDQARFGPKERLADRDIAVPRDMLLPMTKSKHLGTSLAVPAGWTAQPERDAEGSLEGFASRTSYFTRDDTQGAMLSMSVWQGPRGPSDAEVAGQRAAMLAEAAARDLAAGAGDGSSLRREDCEILRHRGARLTRCALTSKTGTFAGVCRAVADGQLLCAAGGPTVDAGRDAEAAATTIIPPR